MLSSAKPMANPSVWLLWSVMQWIFVFQTCDTDRVSHCPAGGNVVFTLDWINHFVQEKKYQDDGEFLRFFACPPDSILLSIFCITRKTVAGVTCASRIPRTKELVVFDDTVVIVAFHSTLSFRTPALSHDTSLSTRQPESAGDSAQSGMGAKHVGIISYNIWVHLSKLKYLVERTLSSTHSYRPYFTVARSPRIPLIIFDLTRPRQTLKLERSWSFFQNVNQAQGFIAAFSWHDLFSMPLQHSFMGVTSVLSCSCSVPFLL